jgi:Ser/Thr protein kinase RdoA (MazF antagonist)
MTQPCNSLIRAFHVYGDIVSVVPYGSGHINNTYCVTLSQAGTAIRYILQKINHDLFPDVPALMQNVLRVCQHTQARLADAQIHDASRRSLTVIPTTQGEAFLQDGQDYWRMYLFIENATGYDVIENGKQAYEAAKAFGQFQATMADLPGDRLHETIPQFHNTRKRLQALKDAIHANKANRLDACRPEIAWALQHQQLADTLLSLWETNQIPERITHNDTKLNNVLIDSQTDQAVCVIDLDTVMPGLALYDFGDMVRTATSPAPEDEKDLSKVTMQMPMFEALAKGYLEGTAGMLNAVEIENLPIAGMVITYTIGIRFLTDYLLGDVYFKTHRPNHNLDRCRTQFTLIKSMQRQQQEMKAVIETIAGT